MFDDGTRNPVTPPRYREHGSVDIDQVVEGQFLAVLLPHLAHSLRLTSGVQRCRLVGVFSVTQCLSAGQGEIDEWRQCRFRFGQVCGDRRIVCRRVHEYFRREFASQCIVDSIFAKRAEYSLVICRINQR